MPGYTPVTCPFCGEDDFDLTGLKLHLGMHCKPFDDTPINDPDRKLRRVPALQRRDDL